MSLATYGELRAAVAAWATKTSLSAQIPDFVAWAHQEICRRLRAPVLYARADLAIGGETVAAPAGFLAARRLYLDVTPRVVLQVTDTARLAEITARCGRELYPSHFAVEGADTLAFAPLFTGAAAGKLLYYRAPDALAEDGDSNVVLARYPFLYLWGALEALFRFLEDDNNAAIYAGQFGALIESVNAQETRDATRGPLAGAPAACAVV